MIKNSNLALVVSFASVTISAQMFKVGHPDLLRTISEGVLHRENVQEEVRKRSVNVLDFIASHKSYLKTLVERRQRIKMLRREIIEANRDLCSGSKTSQDLEAELFSLLALGSLPEEKGSSGSIIETTEKVELKNWHVPGILLAPGNAGSDQNADLQNAPVIDIQEQPFTLEWLQQRYKALETNIINKFHSGLRKRERAYLKREEKVLIEADRIRFASQRTAFTQAATAVEVSRNLPIQDVLALEWELCRRHETAMTFADAQSYANYRSRDGWRLPSIWELFELYRQRNVLGNDLASVVPGYDCHIGWFWSNTPGVASDFYWQLGFETGYPLVSLSTDFRRVRLVRGQVIDNEHAVDEEAE